MPKSKDTKRQNQADNAKHAGSKIKKGKAELGDDELNKVSGGTTQSRDNNL